MTASDPREGAYGLPEGWAAHYVEAPFGKPEETSAASRLGSETLCLVSRDNEGHRSIELKSCAEADEHMPASVRGLQDRVERLRGDANRPIEKQGEIAHFSQLLITSPWGATVLIPLLSDGSGGRHPHVRRHDADAFSALEDGTHQRSLPKSDNLTKLVAAGVKVLTEDNGNASTSERAFGYSALDWRVMRLFNPTGGKDTAGLSIALQSLDLHEKLVRQRRAGLPTTPTTRDSGHQPGVKMGSAARSVRTPGVVTPYTDDHFRKVVGMHPGGWAAARLR